MKGTKSKSTKNQRINVLYITNKERFHGGVQKILCHLMEHLDRSRVKPYFISVYDGEVTEYIRNLGVPFLKINGFKRSNPIPFIYSQIQLIYLILKKKINIIHNNQCEDTFYTWLPAFLTNTKIIIHHRDGNVSRMGKFFLNHVDCNICMSNWQNEKFLNNKAVLIHEGVELQNIRQHIEDAKAKPTMEVKKQLVVGLVGRIAPMKGQDTFINAAKIVLDRMPDIRFFMYGEINSGYYQDYYLELLNMIKKYKIGDKVLFRGFVNKEEDIYSELDISVVPSLFEPFGMVIIEAMAFGKPVIATNVAGPLDIVTEQTGILVPVNDPSALADAILFLADNPEVRNNMGKSGRERVEKHFAIEGTLSKIYDVYENLLHKRVLGKTEIN